MEQKDREKEQLLKSISSLLDETIEEVEKLSKGDVNFSDLKLQPNEQGDMADQAGQGGKDDLDPMKKEDEEEAPVVEEEKKEEPKSEEAEEAAEDKEEEKEEDKEEDKEEEKDEDDPEMAKFEALLGKCLQKMGLLSTEPKVEEVKKSETEDEKEEDPKEDLVKAQSEKIESLEKTIADLSKTVEDLAKRPVGRKSVSGNGAGRLAKSEEHNEERPAIQKGAVLDQLLEAQRGGDKRVNPVLVAKFEQTGDMSLVKDIVK